MLILADLRCEFAENPLGIDSAAPRLSWVAAGSDPFARGLRQSAYQIRAATAANLLTEITAAPDLWDSGMVTSSACLVEYGGRPLRSRECCWWQVRAWDADGEPGPYSVPACFEMGLLQPADWRAEWIGFPGAWPGRALYVRRDFTLEKPIRSARVYMAGLGWSELSINGEKVSDRVLDPPQSDYAKRVYYTTSAVDALLRPGRNTLGVVLGSGWYGTVRLKLQMHIDYIDGSSQVLYTQSNWAEAWHVSPGPVQENSVYDGETYDARLEVPGWDRPETPPRDWLPAAGADGPGGVLVSAALEPIRVMETLTPRHVTQPKAGVYVFDLGQNIAGWARLRVRGERGTRVSLRYAESLYPDGTINPENLRTARVEDVYILKGGDEETWEPRFTYHGFRYIQIEGFPGTPEPENVQGRVVRSAVPSAGTFECSNELLNRVHQMVRWTEMGNLHSLPTDCPQRDERMGWLNDMAARSEQAVYNFNLARLYAKWTADIADEQDPATGTITDTAPFRWGRRPADPVSVCYLLIPWLLYNHYGDKRTMALRYSGMKAWVDFLSTQTEGGILRYSYYGDWAPPVGEGLEGSLGSSAVSRDTPGELISTACYAYSARLLAQMAAVLDRRADAALYSALSEKVARDYNRCYWDESRGGYGTNNQSCNAISLYMELVPPERVSRVITNLVRDVVERHEDHLSTGNICTKYLLEALTTAGRADVALAVAAQETYPSWGYMLANGATTLWERWELATGGGMNSHNHPMLGSVGAWFYRALAGIQPDPAGPGFERVTLKPNVLPGLSAARAALITVRGPLECGWQMEDGALNLSAVVPVGSTARLLLPAAPGCTVSEGGQTVWAAEHSADLPAGICSAARAGSALEILLGSGTYHFTVTP